MTKNWVSSYFKALNATTMCMAAKDSSRKSESAWQRASEEGKAISVGRKASGREWIHLEGLRFARWGEGSR